MEVDLFARQTGKLPFAGENTSFLKGTTHLSPGHPFMHPLDIYVHLSLSLPPCLFLGPFCQSSAKSIKPGQIVAGREKDTEIERESDPTCFTCPKNERSGKLSERKKEKKKERLKHLGSSFSTALAWALHANVHEALESEIGGLCGLYHLEILVMEWPMKPMQRAYQVCANTGCHNWIWCGCDKVQQGSTCRRCGNEWHRP